MNKRRSLIVAICASLLALTFVFGFIPAGFLLPTLFAVCCFGFGISFFASTAFGVVSLILFATNPSNLFYGTVGWYFINYPWMPILARMFIGPIAHAVYLLMCKLTKKWGVGGKVASISVASGFGCFINTLFVGALIFAVGSENLPANFDKITVGFLAINGVIEIAIASIIMPPIVLAVKKASPRLFLQLELPKKMPQTESEAQEA